MIPTDPPAQARHHLLAAAAAISVLLAMMAGVGLAARAQERENLDRLLPIFGNPTEHDEADQGSASYLEHLKNQGIALQSCAFERPDLLPLYGSSELMKNVPDKPNLFFRHFPSGFAVAPVGKAGTTSLIMLHKLGSLGGVAAGRRVAISLSPSWFLRDALADHPYDGNFSRQQAFATLLNPRLSFAVKHELARRMLLRPRTLNNDALLRFLTHRMARGDAFDRALVHAVWPLAQVQRSFFAVQDHFEVLSSLTRHASRLPTAPARVPAALDWDHLIAEATQTAANEPPSSAIVKPRPGADEAFREELARSPEWNDFELLLRGMHELDLLPIVFCMPNSADFYRHLGVAQESLDLFPARLRAIAGRYGVRVEAFEEREHDRDFIVGHADHLSVKGWMYYNRALDGFYHTQPAVLERGLAKGQRRRPVTPPHPREG